MRAFPFLTPSRMVAYEVELSIARDRPLEFHRINNESRATCPGLSIRHDIAEHCRLNNKAAYAKWSVIDH
jgi:hypothetical protein